MQFYLGSSGVPVSYIVDGKGVIRYQYIGPIGPSEVSLLLAQLREAEG